MTNDKSITFVKDLSQSVLRKFVLFIFFSRSISEFKWNLTRTLIRIQIIGVVYANPKQRDSGYEFASETKLGQIAGSKCKVPIELNQLECPK